MSIERDDMFTRFRIGSYYYIDLISDFSIKKSKRKANAIECQKIKIWNAVRSKLRKS